MLRTNNLERVCVQWVVKVGGGDGGRGGNQSYEREEGTTKVVVSYAEVAKIMEKMILEPEIEHDLPEFLEKMHDEDYQRKIMKKNDLSRNTRKNVNYFAEHLPKLRRFFSEGFKDALPNGTVSTSDHYGRIFTHTQESIEEVKIGYLLNTVGLLNVRMLENLEKCQQNLQGIRWITRNPQRQWTSSINPIMADPREFYGKRNYLPFVIGIPKEVESALRILRKRDNVVLRLIPKDVVGLLFEELCLVW